MPIGAGAGNIGKSTNALLVGKLFDDRGNRMTPSYAIKKGVRYRYYVSSVVVQGRKDEAGSVARIAATTSKVMSKKPSRSDPRNRTTSS